VAVFGATAAGRLSAQVTARVPLTDAAEALWPAESGTITEKESGTITEKVVLIP
jgi:hypothetical protein